MWFLNDYLNNTFLCVDFNVNFSFFNIHNAHLEPCCSDAGFCVRYTHFLNESLVTLAQMPTGLNFSSQTSELLSDCGFRGAV